LRALSLPLAAAAAARRAQVRTIERLNALASRSDQSSVTLTFLVLRALNDEEPCCEDAIAYLQARAAPPTPGRASRGRALAIDGFSRCRFQFISCHSV
jgi:hypothetical protein